MRISGVKCTDFLGYGANSWNHGCGFPRLTCMDFLCYGVDFRSYRCGLRGYGYGFPELQVLISEVACANFWVYGSGFPGLRVRVFGVKGPYFERTGNSF